MEKTAKPDAGNAWSELTFGAANYAQLSPITFLPRAAEIHPTRIAVVHGTRFINYARTPGAAPRAPR